MKSLYLCDVIKNNIVSLPFDKINFPIIIFNKGMISVTRQWTIPYYKHVFMHWTCTIKNKSFGFFSF